MTWPGCQNRKCTYVNNRCIRSRNIRIISLTMDRLKECNCDAHKKKVGVELLYNSVKTGSQLVWRPDHLETRCGRESQHPAEGALRPLIGSWGSDELEIRCGRENQLSERLGPQAPSWAIQENGKETLMAIRVGFNMLQFCSVFNSLSHTTLSIKCGVYLSKRLCRSSLLCCCYVLHTDVHAYVDVYILCVCIVSHGCDYTTVLVDIEVERSITVSVWGRMPVDNRMMQIKSLEKLAPHLMYHSFYFNRSWRLLSFPSPWLVAIWRLKSPVCPSIYWYLGGE